MCGIVGVISATVGNTKQKEEFMRLALYTDTLRGENSTGMFYVDRTSKDCNSFKATVPGYEFITINKVDKILNSTFSHECMVGHNRFKTMGGLYKQDAHPHNHEHITLVHNGGIENAFTLKGYDHDKSDPTVDTFRLTKAFATEGAQKTLEEATGSYALVWWDAIENKLFMARNNKRPLAVCWGKEKEALYFASEWPMLVWMMHRCGIEPDGKSFELTPDHIYKFNVDKQVTFERTKFEPPKEHVIFIRQNNWNEYVDDTTGEVVPLRRHSSIESPYQAGPRPPVAGFLPKHAPIANISSIMEEKANEEAKYATGTKIKKINKALKGFAPGVLFNSKIWAIPQAWLPYKNNSLGLGVGQFTWLSHGTMIHVHNITAHEYDHFIDAEVIVPITVINGLTNTKIILGKLNAFNNGGWNIVHEIASNDDTIKLFPSGGPKKYSKKEYLQFTKDGCVFCKKPIFVVDAPDLVWIDSYPAHGDCSDIEEEVQKEA